MKQVSYHNFFMNFANKAKLNIILSLEKGPLSVSQITKKTGQEQSAVSHNLKKLAYCHVLNVKREGKERIYSLNKETVMPIIQIVKEHVRKNCMIQLKKVMGEK